MNRLKAVLAPASPAGAQSRRVVVGLSALMAGVVCAGSFAVAAQREPVVVAAPDIAIVAQPVPDAAVAARPEALPGPAAVAMAEAVPAPAPVPRPVVAATPVETAAPLEPVRAAQDAAPPAEISRVTWTQHPAPMYPAVAAANGVGSGTVTLSCMVQPDGSASGCAILSETPEGQGFGEAALASMERARFSPAMLATATPGVRARFTIRFRLAE
jgi:protein TonB